MGPHAPDEPAARAPRYFPTFDEVVEANRAVHDHAGEPERFQLRDPGFLVDALARTDGNRRTVVEAYLANNGLAHLSPPDAEDHLLARYLNGTVDDGTHAVERYVDLFARRLGRRTPRRDDASP